MSSPDPFSREALRIVPGVDFALPKQRTSESSAGKKQRFLPAIPEQLFDRLIALPGKALAFYLIVLQRSRMERANPVVLTSARLKQSGIGREDKRRALRALESAGLIRVERRSRRNPLVTLLQEKLRR